MSSSILYLFIALCLSQSTVKEKEERESIVSAESVLMVALIIVVILIIITLRPYIESNIEMEINDSAVITGVEESSIKLDNAGTIIEMNNVSEDNTIIQMSSIKPDNETILEELKTSEPVLTISETSLKSEITNIENEANTNISFIDESRNYSFKPVNIEPNNNEKIDVVADNQSIDYKNVNYEDRISRNEKHSNDVLLQSIEVQNSFIPKSNITEDLFIKNEIEPGNYNVPNFDEIVLRIEEEDEVKLGYNFVKDSIISDKIKKNDANLEFSSAKLQHPSNKDANINGIMSGDEAENIIPPVRPPRTKRKVTILKSNDNRNSSLKVDDKSDIEKFKPNEVDKAWHNSSENINMQNGDCQNKILRDNEFLDNQKLQLKIGPFDSKHQNGTKQCPIQESIQNASPQINEVLPKSMENFENPGFKTPLTRRRSDAYNSIETMENFHSREIRKTIPTNNTEEKIKKLDKLWSSHMNHEAPDLVPKSTTQIKGTSSLTSKPNSQIKNNSEAEVTLAMKSIYNGHYRQEKSPFQLIEDSPSVRLLSYRPLEDPDFDSNNQSKYLNMNARVHEQQYSKPKLDEDYFERELSVIQNMNSQQNNGGNEFEVLDRAVEYMNKIVLSMKKEQEKLDLPSNNNLLVENEQCLLSDDNSTSSNQVASKTKSEKKSKNVFSHLFFNSK